MCDVVKLNIMVKKNMVKNNWGSKKCCVQSFFGESIFMGQQNVWSKCRVQFFCETKILGPLFLGEQSFPKKCCVQIFRVKQDLLVKKKFGQKHLWFQKKLGLKKNCETIFLDKKNVGHKIFDYKKSSVQINCIPKKVW